MSKGKERYDDEPLHRFLGTDDHDDDEETKEWVEPVTNAQVQNRNVGWDTLHRAKFLTEKSLALLKEYDKQPPEAQQQLLDEAGPTYAELFLQLLGSDTEGVANKDFNQYILSWIDDIIKDEDRIQLFLRIKDTPGSSSDKKDKSEALPYRTFLDQLRRSDGDWFINSRASRIVATLLVSSNRVSMKEAKSLVLWCITHMRDHKESTGDLIIATYALQILLRKNEYRVMFGQDNGLEIMYSLLKDHMDNTQLLYRILFCFWVVSFMMMLQQDFQHTEDLLVTLLKF